MTTYTASSTEQSSATTENDIQVTASASATATSDVSQSDAQNIANLVASQDAMSQAIFSANLLNQSIPVVNLQQYEPVYEGYILYSELAKNESFIVKTDKYTLSTNRANYYDAKTNEIIGTWGNYKQAILEEPYVSSYQQVHLSINNTPIYYVANRYGKSILIPVGTTYIAQVITYHDDTNEKDTKTYIPHLWRSTRVSKERADITILKGISDNSA